MKESFKQSRTAASVQNSPNPKIFLFSSIVLVLFSYTKSTVSTEESSPTALITNASPLSFSSISTPFTPMPPHLIFFLLLSTSVVADVDFSATESPPDLRSRPLILVKIWCLLIVFVVTLIAGVSPYLMKWNLGFVLLGTQFAGGVFLGTALMQFLSDSNRSFERLRSNDYPFAFMLASVGFLFTMLIDCIVLHVYRKRKSLDSGNVRRIKTSSSIASSSRAQVIIDNDSGHQIDPSFLTASSFGDSVLLLTSLCFHSVFEGIAIGVANTSNRAWRVLWTVTLHKIFVSIAMGISVLHMIPERPLFSCLLYSFAFSVSTPLGVAIGIVIDATTRGVVADWIYAVFMGLFAGIFIYVSVCHLVSKGYSPHTRVSVDMPHFKFLAVLLGIGVVALVMVWDA